MLVLSEEPPDIVQERLEALGHIENDPNLMVHTVPGDIDETALHDIGLWMQAHPGGLLVVDTLSEYASIEDESSNAQIVRKLGPLKRLARQHGATVLLVHHDRKNAEDADEGKRIRGGSGYLAIADQVFMMGRTGGVGSTRRVISSIGRYTVAHNKRTVIEWNGGAQFTLLSADGSGGMTGAAEKVWKVLEEAAGEPLTVKEIHERAGVDQKHVGTILKSWESPKAAPNRLPIKLAGMGRRGNAKRYAKDCGNDPHKGVIALPPSIEGLGTTGVPGIDGGNALTPEESTPAIPLRRGERLLNEEEEAAALSEPLPV